MTTNDEHRTGLDVGAPDVQLRIRQADLDLCLVEDLRERREGLGLTQTEVARRMGRHQSVVSNLERLGSDPRFSSIRRYAGALGVLIEYRLSTESLLEASLDRTMGKREVTVSDDVAGVKEQLRASL